MAKKAKKTKKKKRSTSANTVRDENGHFIKGNRCSVGNKGNTSERAKKLKRGNRGLTAPRGVTAKANSRRAINVRVQAKKKAQNQAKKPMTHGQNGRDEKGRFTQGNQISVGVQNPFSVKSKELRDALLAMVSPADIQDIIKKQVEKAKAGNNESAKIVLDRCLGKPSELDSSSNLPPALKDIIPFEEVMQYVLSIGQLPPLGGIDMKSIEGNGQVLKMGNESFSANVRADFRKEAV